MVLPAASKDLIHLLIINFNTHWHTIECVESVLKQRHQNFKIVIVDNSADLTSVEAITNWASGNVTDIATSYPDLVYPLALKPVQLKVLAEQEHYAENDDLITIIKAKQNNGFAAANNIGLKYLLQQQKFKWVWLLNNDTVIYNDCLTNFVNSKISSDAGMIGTKLLNYHTPGLLQGIGGKFNKWLGSTKHVGENQFDTGQFDEIDIEKGIDYVIGASMFVSKQFVTSVGLMSEDYFLYFEELDWKFRSAKLNWRHSWLPGCRVIHKEGGTILGNQQKSVINDVCSVRNRILITKKFNPVCLITVYPLLLLVILNRIRRRQLNRLTLLFKAVVLNQDLKTVLKIR